MDADDPQADTSFGSRWQAYAAARNLLGAQADELRGHALEWFSWGVVHGVRRHGELEALNESIRAEEGPTGP